MTDSLGDASGPGSCAPHGAASASPPSAAIPIARDVGDVAQYIGNLYGAAWHDAETANPSDVTFDGTAVSAWRRAYLEGCKDMANGVAARLPEMKDAVLAAFQTQRALLAQGIEAGTAETAQQAPCLHESPTATADAPEVTIHHPIPPTAA